ncbi:MAG: FlgD immunoglobulin-like domain containing protein, partial [Ignavibacteriales bacterium]
QLANGFENTIITNEAAHSGTYSLKFDIPKGTHDAWVGTKRFPLPANTKPGDVLHISVWIKASKLMPDSAIANPGTWGVGFTPIFHSGWKNNDAYDEIGSQDLVFTFPAKDTAFNWTQYSIDYPVPNDPKAKALSVRIHVYSRFQGTIYFDDVNVQTTTVTAVHNKGGVVKEFNLEQNYPNPFNPTTTIRYSIPERAFVTLKIYDILGREVRTLINAEQNVGVYNVIWNGENNYGTKVSSGTYIYRVEAGSFNQVKKMILLK